MIEFACSSYCRRLGREDRNERGWLFVTPTQMLLDGSLVDPIRGIHEKVSVTVEASSFRGEGVRSLMLHAVEAAGFRYRYVHAGMLTMDPIW